MALRRVSIDDAPGAVSGALSELLDFRWCCF